MNKKFAENMNKYFKSYLNELKQVYEVFRQTEYGRSLNLSTWSFNSYDDFLSLPILDSKVNFDELFIPGENLYPFITSRSTGTPKVIYKEIGGIFGYSDQTDKLLKSRSVVFLHSKRRSGEGFYETIDYNHKRMYPNAFFAEFSNREELLKYVSMGDVLFIIEYPLMCEWILFQMEKALKSKEICLSDIKKEKVFLKISGEHISPKRLKKIVERIKKLFQTDVEYSISYGANEIGLIGVYVPRKHGYIYHNNFIYKIIPTLFVEVVNNEIILTPFRTKGTILFRYRIGDIGKLFFKRSNPYIQIYGRKESTMYLAGSQLNIDSLYYSIEKMVSPLSLKIINTAEEAKQNINIVVISPTLLSKYQKQRIARHIKQFITESSVLSIENHLEIVKINIRFSREPIKKKWFVVHQSRR